MNTLYIRWEHISKECVSSDRNRYFSDVFWLLTELYQILGLGVLGQRQPKRLRVPKLPGASTQTGPKLSLLIRKTPKVPEKGPKWSWLRPLVRKNAEWFGFRVKVPSIKTANGWSIEFESVYLCSHNEPNERTKMMLKSDDTKTHKTSSGWANKSRIC